jgi:hypothetical protein
MLAMIRTTSSPPLLSTVSATLLLAALLGSCAAERALTWTYEVPAGLERAGSSVIARIREGGCAFGDEVIYEIRPRDMEAPTIPTPTLEADHTYCFDVTLEDSTCEAYARSTVIVMVDAGLEMPTVTNVLAMDTPRACPSGSVCSPSRGCLRCEGAQFFCPADSDGADRCCFFPGEECSDTVFCAAL